MTRGEMRTLMYVYLGTESSDPAYPAASLNLIIDSVESKLLAEVRQSSAAYLEKTDTLESATREYDLPADFAGWLDVRVKDETGRQLDERRSEDLASASVAAFAITGPDQAAKLRTNDGVTEGDDIWLRYSYWPAVMGADASAPDWMPTRFHSLIPRMAAEQVAGLGDEAKMPSEFLLETLDLHALFIAHLGRRGIANSRTR